MRKQETHTQLNEAQLFILQLLEHTKTKTELQELKSVLAKFYAKKADDAMKKLVDSKKITPAKLKSLAKKHLRTPYK